MAYEPLIRGLWKACPRCSDGKLQWRSWRHWQHVLPDGRRSGDHLVYYQCDRCWSKIKIFKGGMIRDAGEEEWAQHCDPRRG